MLLGASNRLGAIWGLCRVESVVLLCSLHFPLKKTRLFHLKRKRAYSVPYPIRWELS